MLPGQPGLVQGRGGIRHCCPKWCHIWCPGSLRPYSKVGDFSKRSEYVVQVLSWINRRSKNPRIAFLRRARSLLSSRGFGLFWFYWVKPLLRSAFSSKRCWSFFSWFLDLQVCPSILCMWQKSARKNVKYAWKFKETG